VEVRKEKKGNHTKKAALSPPHKGGICLQPALPPPPQESDSQKEKGSWHLQQKQIYLGPSLGIACLRLTPTPILSTAKLFSFEIVRSSGNLLLNLNRQNAAVERSHQQSTDSILGTELKSLKACTLKKQRILKYITALSFGTLRQIAFTTRCYHIAVSVLLYHYTVVFIHNSCRKKRKTAFGSELLNCP